MAYSDHFETIVQEIDQLIKKFSQTKKDIGYGYRWTFTNGHWVDLIDYKKTGSVIFRVGRGAWLVNAYPMLGAMFDEVLGVITKFEVTSIGTLHNKHII